MAEYRSALGGDRRRRTGGPLGHLDIRGDTLKRQDEGPVVGTAPDLVVRLPPGSLEEREYIATVILSDWLGLDIVFESGAPGFVDLYVPGSPGTYIRVPDLLLEEAEGGWRSARLPRKGGCASVEVSLLLANGSNVTRQVPLLFGENRYVDPAVAGADVLKHDVFGVAFFYLAGCDDFLTSNRDGFGRQRFAGSLADVAESIDHPIVDYLVDHLWLCLKRVFPGLPRKSVRYRAWLTHDVDQMVSWASISLYRSGHAIAGDLVRRRSARLALKRGLSRLRHSVVLAGQDPFDTFDFLMSASEQISLRSSFFFLLGGPSPVDYANDVATPSARKLFDRIRSRGHEIGLHGSAGSMNQPRLLREHLDELRLASGEDAAAPSRWGGRQHYLTWRASWTWKACDSAGLTYDSSVAFPERAGFRAGTCRPFAVFDLSSRKRLALEERPLVVMDGTLRFRMGLAPAESLSLASTLAQRCRESAGVFTLLWHNSSLLLAEDRDDYLELLASVQP